MLVPKLNNCWTTACRLQSDTKMIFDIRKYIAFSWIRPPFRLTESGLHQELVLIAKPKYNEKGSIYSKPLFIFSSLIVKLHCTFINITILYAYLFVLCKNQENLKNPSKNPRTLLYMVSTKLSSLNICKNLFWGGEMIGHVIMHFYLFFHVSSLIYPTL